jgi:hypothetical protein
MLLRCASARSGRFALRLRVCLDDADDVGYLVQGEIKRAKRSRRIEDEGSRSDVIPVLGVDRGYPDAGVEEQRQREQRSARIRFVASPPRRTGSPSKASIPDRSWFALTFNSRSASSRRKPLRVARRARACVSMRSSRSSGSETMTFAEAHFTGTVRRLPPWPDYIQYCQRWILVAGEGFEPSKAEPTRLQRVPFDRSGTPPGGRV